MSENQDLDNFSDQEFIDVDDLVNDLATNEEAEQHQANQNQSQGQAQQKQGSTATKTAKPLPDVIVKFVKVWYKAFLNNDNYQLFGCYNNNLVKLFDKFFAKQWPLPTEISKIVDDDQIFTILYSECYYRHIYSKNTSPSLDARTSSFNNYCNLFNLILNNEQGPVGFVLPDKWLWDMIDEFIYQFNEFQIYKSKLNNKQEKTTEELEELDYLLTNQEVWSTYSVLNALYSLVGKSNIIEQLKLGKMGKNVSKEIAGDYGSLPLYKNLGYFSVIGLLRIHTLLGDYTLALKTIEDIELSKKAFFTKIPSCHFTLYYYVGFCFLMMNRYQDAIKSFQHILLYFIRTKNLQNSRQSFDITTKKSEQMFSLLMICISLCATRLDDFLSEQLKDKFNDQYAKLTKTSNDKKAVLSTYEDLFKFGAPRFIDSNINTNVHSDPLNKHWNIFKLSLMRQLNTPNLKFYLNLYSSLELNKLSKLMDLNSVEELNDLLLAFKLNNRQLKQESKEEQAKQQQDNASSSTSQSLLQGSYKTIYNIDIVVDDDHVNVLNFKNSRKYGDWFIRNCNKNYAVIDLIKNQDSSKKETTKAK